MIVPVRDQWEHTRSFLTSLDADEVGDVLVMDNGSIDVTAQRIRQWQRPPARWAAEYPAIGKRLHRSDMTGLLIYDMWNAGFARARKLAAGNPFYVLVSNNDIVLPRGALTHLRILLACDERHWITYPDYDAPWRDDVGALALQSRVTRGVLSDGGMFGACFMVAGHRIPWPQLVTDTGYKWWYGDNHLAEHVEQEGGLQVRVEGLPVRHVNEATARHHPETEGWKWQDRQRWMTRHQRWVSRETDQHP